MPAPAGAAAEACQISDISARKGADLFGLNHTYVAQARAPAERDEQMWLEGRRGSVIVDENRGSKRKEASEMSNRERETRLSDDGTRLIIVERWIDRQVSPPRWRSKNRHRQLVKADRAYLQEHPGGLESFKESLSRSSSAC